VWGHVGDDVARVTANLTDGVVVQTTVSNGYVAAWWPTTPPTDDAGQKALPFTLTWYLTDGTPGGTYEWTSL